MAYMGATKNFQTLKNIIPTKKFSKKNFAINKIVLYLSQYFFEHTYI